MIRGFWAVVTLDRPQGATVERLTEFMAYAEARALLDVMRKDSPTPKLLGLAATSEDPEWEQQEC